MMFCVYVVVPIYNVEQYLKECLESIQNQTYQNIKVIMINDGSTDTSGEIAKTYLKDSRFTLIEQENGGAGKARNVGIKSILASSPNLDDFITFVDNDDYLDENFIAKMVEKIQIHHEAEILLGKVLRPKADDLQNQENRKNTFQSGMKFLENVSGEYFCWAGVGGGVKLKLLVEYNILFPEGIINEDLIFGFECFLKSKSIGYFDGCYYYRLRHGSISCSSTFSQHSNTLLFRSYFANAKFLYQLLQNPHYKTIFPLIQRCLCGSSSMPILCWIKDKTLAHKSELRFLVPYMKIKVKIAFFLSPLTRLLYHSKRIVSRCIKKH